MKCVFISFNCFTIQYLFNIMSVIIDQHDVNNSNYMCYVCMNSVNKMS